MPPSTYQQQVTNQRGAIDLDFWRSPEGVSVPDDELRFLLIVSGARIADAAETAPADAHAAAGFRVSVKASEAGKCVRCWHRREDVGSHAEHPELCGRCVENVDGPGETRRMT